MKYPEYRSHLGFFRHFAALRRLYDDLQAAKDQLKVQKVTSGEREKELQGIITHLQNELLRKNNVRPVETTPKTHNPPKSVEYVARTPLEIVNQRQADLDTTATALNRLHAEAEAVRFQEEARSILST